MQTCVQCRASFHILPAEQEFYREWDFPEPEFCPDCRHQRRCAHRNERVLYKRKCDLCRKPLVTLFSGAEPFPVYCPECFWGDQWDALSYGRDFDFNRPFFEQFHELQNAVPRLSLNNLKHENSEYCSQCIGNKNCYLLFAADDNEDCMYSYWINRCMDTYNSSNLADCTLCFDLIDSENCYQCVASQDLKNCINCYFSFDLIGCQDCFGSAGLRNQKYYIFNEPYAKEEYFEKLNSFRLGNFEQYEKQKQQFLQTRLRVPHKYIHILNSEDCTGDYISNSKNCRYCFDAFDSEDCRYAFNLVHQHYRNFDVSYVTECRNVYQLMSSIGENNYFGILIWYSTECWYCDLILSNCQHLFGCVALRNQKHCILNQKYSPQEFQTLRDRIVAHMKQTGEWGKFFPVENSLHAYNETAAQDYFPLTKAEVVARGWKWKDNDPKDFQPQTYVIPDNITETDDEITRHILACTNCGRNYRILEQELKMYRKVQLPLPRHCPECRFLNRMKLRNPRKLYQRVCQKCGVAIQTTYPPDRLEMVYCEQCYLETVGA